MGIFINTGNWRFKASRNGEYIDKSGLIAIINDTLNSRRQFSCVTRCRRFGKSMAAEMLCAYYDQSCDSNELFNDLEISKHPSFKKHLNKYPVIFLDISDFVTRYKNDDIVSRMDAKLRDDIHGTYPDVEMHKDDDLMDYLIRIAGAKKQQFIFIIDEWDAICREFEHDSSVMDRYVDWLRRMFKGGSSAHVFAGVYMTGILPIKKYQTESALNNFIEYSMVRPGVLASFFGFTKKEVSVLAERHGMDFDELEKWYDGYQIGDEMSMFNPNSVMQAIYNDFCDSYWGSTGAFTAVAGYIQMNFEGLKDDIIRMLAGGRSKVEPTMFQNDMSIIRSRDDVLTVMIHLGYLSYDRRKNECYIPNREVAGEMINAIKSNNWRHVVDALDASERLLQDTLDGNEEGVARGISVVHDDNTSILSYNDEKSLACVLSLAYYYAKNDYVMHREMASGKGFADIVLIPRRNVDSPAIVIELKCDKDAVSAINQIKNKDYPAKVREYVHNMLLVGINYDRKTKTHSCVIEKPLPGPPQ